MSLDKIHESWNPIKGYLNQQPLLTLKEDILPECSFQPEKENIFRVFQMPVTDIKVVILGDGPYPTKGDAVGLAFVKPKDRSDPASLKNIKKEVLNSDADNVNTIVDTGDTFYKKVDMLSWKDQGVFLLNTALTVEVGNAGSHLKYWKAFTESVVRFISYKKPCIWVLWGKKAQEYKHFIQSPLHVNGYDRSSIEEIPSTDYENYILQAPHPAAESYSGSKAGFFGCDHFFFINRILELKKLEKINW